MQSNGLMVALGLRTLEAHPQHIPLYFDFIYLMMVNFLFAAILAATVISALSIATPGQAALGHNSDSEQQFLIELGPGDRKWIVEEEKWALRRV